MRPKLKRLTIPRVGKNVDELKLLYTAHENVSDTKCLENSFSDSQKVKPIYMPII